MTALTFNTSDRLLNLPNSRVAVKQSNGQAIQVYISNDRKETLDQRSTIELTK